jgi:hypothetical protein
MVGIAKVLSDTDKVVASTLERQDFCPNFYLKNVAKYDLVLELYDKEFQVCQIMK